MHGTTIPYITDLSPIFFHRFVLAKNKIRTLYVALIGTRTLYVALIGTNPKICCFKVVSNTSTIMDFACLIFLKFWHNIYFLPFDKNIKMSKNLYIYHTLHRKHLIGSLTITYFDH